MAIFHLSAQAISRTGGRSATACAGYRAGECIIDERTGVKHDFTRKRGVVHSEIFAPEGAPSWCHNRSDLWNKVEKTEKRKDAQVAREINLALPAELNERERLELVRAYVADTFVSAGMVVDLCVHAPSSRDGDARNHHAHIMLTMRRLDGDQFGQKERAWNAPELLIQWRKKWADAANAALEKAGHRVRIDHRSHAERGITEQPSQHHGPAVAGILERGADSEVAERQAAERSARELAQLATQVAIAKAQATATLEELAAVEAAEARAQAKAEAECQEQARVDAQAKAEAERQEQARVDAQAVTQAQALAAQMQLWRDKEAASEAEAARKLKQARDDYEAAKKALAEAVRAEDVAQAKVDALYPAWRDAVEGQRKAAQSIWQTTRAIPKLPAWLQAIDAYNAAKSVLAALSAIVQRARQVLANAWTLLMELAPSIRESQQAAKAADQTRQKEQRQAPQASEQEKRDAIRAARLRALEMPAEEKPAEWQPEKLPQEHDNDPQRDRGRDRERG